ncbi:hypothetical protein AAFF_G00374120 [Aldrovandia affinis]|uniref:Uncharacterized protein n=1 Tax=Aldrovandia affinis TaxID=143900 RepID=A0AAD7VZH8_9TELE|nr:hypothetical protein AAFF_G00374120 [Aldrovandia affinis]
MLNAIYNEELDVTDVDVPDVQTYHLNKPAALRVILQDHMIDKLDVNSLQKKQANEKTPAKNVKKARKVVTLAPPVSDLKERWPALFLPAQIKEEYKRITTANLESTFMANLDQCIPSLMPLVMSRGGAAKYKIQKIMELLKDSEGQIGDLESRVMKILVTKSGTASDPASATVMIEGTEVLQGLDVPRACALLMGLIYALNLSYPRELKYTCEVFQKVFLKLDGQKSSPKVTSLKQKLLGKAFEPHR